MNFLVLKHIFGNSNFKIIDYNTNNHITDINDEAVSFNRSENSYLMTNLGTDFNLLESTILLSVRSTQHRALLFYLYDSYNNFMQLELQNANALKLSYNNFDEIKHGTLLVNGKIMAL